MCFRKQILFPAVPCRAGTNALVPAKEVNNRIVVSFLCLETTMSRSPSPPPLYAHRKEWEDVQPIAQHDEGTNPVAQIFYSEACTFCFSSLIVRRCVFSVDAMCDLPLSRVWGVV